MQGFFKKPFAEVVAEQKIYVQHLDARRRGLRPVNDQLKQSRARLGHLQERRAKETKGAKAIEKEIATFLCKLGMQCAKATATSEEIGKAKQGISQLSLAALLRSHAERAQQVLQLLFQNRRRPWQHSTTFQRHARRLAEQCHGGATSAPGGQRANP